MAWGSQAAFFIVRRTRAALSTFGWSRCLGGPPFADDVHANSRPVWIRWYARLARVGNHREALFVEHRPPGYSSAAS